MKCYDCASHQNVTEAVAVCTGCGAGVCIDHATVSPRAVTYTVVTGVIPRQVRGPRAARSLQCPQCAAAERAMISTPS